MAGLSIYSSTTGKLEPYVPIAHGAMTMYVCGVTPYDDAHIGHGRCYVTFDVLYRLLTALGYRVTYCRNITDIDDKLINRAERELGDGGLYRTIAQRYTERFQEDVLRLGCLKPSYEPRVTEHIADIIAAVERLVAMKCAYVLEGSVYFRISSFARYGMVSHQSIADLKAGARVAVDEEKENPLDFVLWKYDPGYAFWDSPWGRGRPGWHLECSVMAHRYLGHPIDIHGGGMDLAFPHHENECALSETLYGEPFVRRWMHNAFVRVKQEKMSKSLKNIIALRDAYERVDPMVLRYYYAIHHYRNPLDFSWDDVTAAQKSYQRLVQWYGQYEPLAPAEFVEEFAAMGNGAYGVLPQRVVELLCADLNVQGMIGALFEHKAPSDNRLGRQIATVLKLVCGLSLQELAQASAGDDSPEAQALLEARRAARARRDWKAADELRDRLKSLGVEVRDDKL